MTSPDFSGLAVALATPFTPAGLVDLPAFRRIVKHVVSGGVEVLVPLGTTGESSTLDERERDLVLQACLEEAGGRAVLAGTGHNATKVAVGYTKRAQALGAQGALVVTPYYNKPTPEGVVAHFAAIAEACPDFPLVAYNVPGRTGVNVAPETVLRLWQIPAVVALKESSGNLAQISEIARTLPDGKLLLAGDDNLALPSIAVGARGLVSVIANLLPREARALVDFARQSRLDQAQDVHHRLRPLMDALFLESSPIPLKAALDLLGIGGPHLRLPLLPASAKTREALRHAMDFATAGSRRFDPPRHESYQ